MQGKGITKYFLPTQREFEEGENTSWTGNKMQGTVFIAASVDGFVAREDGDISWLSPPPETSSSEELCSALNEQDDMGFEDLLNSIDCIVMGRKTFDTVVAFDEEAWPYRDIPMVVWSRDVAVVNSKFPEFIQLKGSVSASSLSPTELFQSLENKGYTRCYVDGPTVIQNFLRDGLIHSIHITSIPILLGKGIRLFSDDGALQIQNDVMLTLVSSKSFKNGMVSSKYELIQDKS